VFLLTDAKRQNELVWRAPDGAYKRFKIMGRSSTRTARCFMSTAFPSANWPDAINPAGQAFAVKMQG
jgi:hypothetical protein